MSNNPNAKEIMSTSSIRDQFNEKTKNSQSTASFSENHQNILKDSKKENTCNVVSKVVKIDRTKNEEYKKFNAQVEMLSG